MQEFCSSTARNRFTLADPDRTVPALRRLMERVGATTEPEVFIRNVSATFQSLQPLREVAAMPARFRRRSSYRDFRAALEKSAEVLPDPCAVLVLGCGDGYAGIGAHFAFSTCREVFGSRIEPRIVRWDLCPEDLLHDRSGGPAFDLVVSHSLFHFIPDLDSAFAAVTRRVAPGGCFVMAHEFNARFWLNAECQAAVACLQARRRLRGRILSALNPERCLRWLARRLRLMRPSGLTAAVNHVLRQRAGHKADLAAEELAAIVDPHRPGAAQAPFRIGLNGFDREDLARRYLTSFDVVWAASSEHLGNFPAASLSNKWRRLERELGAKYPLDGSVCTVLWRKRP